MTHRHDRRAPSAGEPTPAGAHEGSGLPPVLIASIAGAILSVVLLIALAHHWSMTTVSSRQDVATVVGNLQPACRPIMAARFREQLVRKGAPLTRGEVDAIAAGITDCAAIEDQVSGLQG